jgi:Thioesterase-like superfamily
MARVTDAFYRPDGGAFVATAHTRGPWSAEHQHGGPPSALLARALAGAASDFAVTRITVDLLRPVPIDRLTVNVETLRAGAKVQRLVARLLHAERVVAQALAVLARTPAVAITSPPTDPPLPPPEGGIPFEFPFFNEPESYHGAMEIRIVRGDWGSGRVAAWMRQRMPLVAGTPTSPLERVLVAADFGSGVSAAIEHKRVTAINADLSVSVHRPLEGEWVGMDCLSIYEASGIGLADTQLHDRRGPIGRALQSLIIEARPDAPG